MEQSKAELIAQQRVAAMSEGQLVMLVAFLFGMLSESYSGPELLAEYDQAMAEQEEEDEELVA